VGRLKHTRPHGLAMAFEFVHTVQCRRPSHWSPQRFVSTV
jgi:hypothetical protein